MAAVHTLSECACVFRRHRRHRDHCESVTVLDTAVGRWQAEQFYKLGRAGGGSVGGQRYTKQQCYIRVLEIDDQYIKAWFSLGDVEVGVWAGSSTLSSSAGSRYSRSTTSTATHGTV